MKPEQQAIAAEIDSALDSLRIKLGTIEPPKDESQDQANIVNVLNEAMKQVKVELLMLNQ